MKTTSLETSLEARKLGVKQGTSDRVWCLDEYGDWKLYWRVVYDGDVLIADGGFSLRHPKTYKDVVDARSLDEWLEILPKHIVHSGINFKRGLDFVEQEYYYTGYDRCGESVLLGNHIVKCKEDENPSEAAGLLYNWLAENGYLKKVKA